LGEATLAQRQEEVVSVKKTIRSLWKKVREDQIAPGALPVTKIDFDSQLASLLEKVETISAELETTKKEQYDTFVAKAEAFKTEVTNFLKTAKKVQEALDHAITVRKAGLKKDNNEATGINRKD